MGQIRSHTDFEILTTDEYAKRLGIGRTCLSEWKTTGKLIAGKHYIQKGRTVRYIWDLETIRSLHERSTATGSASSGQGPLTRKEKGSEKQPTINLNY